MVEDIKTISPNQTYLKAHMKDGRVYVFHSWYYDLNNDAINGYGSHLDINRVLIEKREKEKSEDTIVSVTGAVYTTERSILKDVLTRLYSQRKEYKKESFKYQQMAYDLEQKIKRGEIELS